MTGNKTNKPLLAKRATSRLTATKRHYGVFSHNGQCNHYNHLNVLLFTRSMALANRMTVLPAILCIVRLNEAAAVAWMALPF